MGDLLNLEPMLRQKRINECPHDYVEVDTTVASLTCTTCGKELDPWWYLRKCAADDAREYTQRIKLKEEFERWCDGAKETYARLHAEIATLYETKNRLYNERVEGRPLGSFVKRRPRTKAKTAT